MKEDKNPTEATIAEIDQYIKGLLNYLKICDYKNRPTIIKNIKIARQHRKRYMTLLIQKKQ